MGVGLLVTWHYPRGQKRIFYEFFRKYFKKNVLKINTFLLEMNTVLLKFDTFLLKNQQFWAQKYPNQHIQINKKNQHFCVEF